MYPMCTQWRIVDSLTFKYAATSLVFHSVLGIFLVRFLSGFLSGFPRGFLVRCLGEFLVFHPRSPAITCSSVSFSNMLPPQSTQWVCSGSSTRIGSLHFGQWERSLLPQKGQNFTSMSLSSPTWSRSMLNR